MKDNLVKDYLEEIGFISPDQYEDYSIIIGEKWEIYRISNNTFIYIRFELTGKIGYAFCVKITCGPMLFESESSYYFKSYTNDKKEEWDCEQDIKNALLCNAVERIQPY